MINCRMYIGLMVVAPATDPTSVDYRRGSEHNVLINGDKNNLLPALNR